MCGKFTQVIAWRELVALADFLRTAKSPAETVTPMRQASVLLADAQGARRTMRMRWGIDGPHARKHIHARAETVDRLPSFRAAFAQRRGLVVVSSFNEGREITPTRTEQHVITPPAPIAIAVIWDGAPPCFAMVTVPPNALIATLTDRMPAVLAAEDWDRWLTGTPGASKALLRPMEGDWEMQPEARDPRQGTLF
jgi:putative SOS response-associated peptidase YedK